MKYLSVDRLQDFEFHDAELSLISWNNFLGKDVLTFSAKMLNLHKNAEPNKMDSDMEISNARITFTGFKIKEFEPSRTWKEDENGKLYTEEPLTICVGDDALSMLKNELNNTIRVVGLVLDDGVYELGASGIDPYFSVRFTFSSVEVEWDDYTQKAWYELCKRYNGQITVSTPDGYKLLDMHIVCQDETTYNSDSSVCVGVRYNEETIFGYGKDYLWIDAFADLQKNLPDDVKLRCCLTCRHGNLCPAGNKAGEVFCTKDVIIKSKNDAFNHTVERDECEKRSRSYTDICEDYAEQTKEYYTYNDYLIYLDMPK